MAHEKKGTLGFERVVGLRCGLEALAAVYHIVAHVLLAQESCDGDAVHVSETESATGRESA